MAWRCRPQGMAAEMLKITLIHVGSRAAAMDGYEVLVDGYLERCSGFARCEVEAFRSEEALLNRISKPKGRSKPELVLLDSPGRRMTSEDFAAWLGSRRDEGAREIAFAIGPADGWTDAARKQAAMVLSFGPMTMAHTLARLVMAEQLYRAVTILTGHPYHRRH